MNNLQYILFSNTHTNPIARLAVITFQPYKKTIQQPKETHQPLSFVMDVPDNPTDPKEVELTEGNKKTPAPNREFFYHNECTN